MKSGTHAGPLELKLPVDRRRGERTALACTADLCYLLVKSLVALNATLDAGLVSAAQAVEHYEIARYGTLKQWAKDLGLKDAVTLLDQTLTEEPETDEALTRLAEGGVNQKAMAA